ncbi:MAG: hypothetical protein JNN30_21470 [Rhodanobacteraceae bacterium]|nr:hypothetical protein [Rhodanobacteraceae bacterium]
MAKTSTTPTTPNRDYLLLAIGMADVLVVAVGALIMVPGFAASYQGFGAEVPTITHLLLVTYRGWGLFALFVPLVWWIWPDPRTRGLVGLIAGSILALLLLAFGLWAGYAPYFALAAHVT